ncbi:TPA: hypothetical protein UOJ00_003005 [Stenotrophomonas maltophilia]|nr:hypothetical protein [Stenotrophomonas maltophilia]
MSHIYSQPLPSTARLLKATALAIGIAAIVLVTIVLPAEYGIDPTGIGKRLGLDGLHTPAEVPLATASASDAATDPADPNAALAAKAEAAFGRNAGQSLDADAVSLVPGTPRRDTLTVTLEPGKGAEVKAHLKTGEGIVFRWTASGDVALDMHGERPDAKGTWTSYAVEPATRGAAGTFVAPFEGSHGWYWMNRGTEPVTVEIEATGFQPELYRP